MALHATPFNMAVVFAISSLLEITSLESLLGDYRLLVLISVIAGDVLISIINQKLSYDLPEELFTTCLFGVLGIVMMVLMVGITYYFVLDFIAWEHQSILHWVFNINVLCIKVITLGMLDISFV